jgi:ATP-dependent DNA helicase RecQ
VIIASLEKAGAVQEKRGGRLYVLKDDLQPAELVRCTRQYEEKVEHDREKLERMMLYGRSTTCRWRLLLDYFAEPFPQECCQNCDGCLHPIGEQLSAPTVGRRPDVPAAPQDKVGESEPLLEKGMVITVPRYGAGRLEAVEDDKVVISFPQAGVRKFTGGGGNC